MLVVLFGFWLLLEGQWTTEIALTGLVLSLLIYLFCWKFLDYSPRREWAFIRRIPRALGYTFWLIREIFRAGFSTMRRVWSPHAEIQPHLVHFSSRLRTRAGQVLLAHSITLTPGTITVSLREGEFLVHALDAPFAEGLDHSEMEERILRVEGGSEA